MSIESTESGDKRILSLFVVFSVTLRSTYIVSAEGFQPRPKTLPPILLIFSWLVSPDVTIAFSQKEPLDIIVDKVPSH